MLNGPTEAETFAAILYLITFFTGKSLFDSKKMGEFDIISTGPQIWVTKFTLFGFTLQVNEFLLYSVVLMTAYTSIERLILLIIAKLSLFNIHLQFNFGYHKGKENWSSSSYFLISIDSIFDYLPHLLYLVPKRQIALL